MSPIISTILLLALLIAGIILNVRFLITIARRRQRQKHKRPTIRRVHLSAITNANAKNSISRPSVFQRIARSTGRGLRRIRGKPHSLARHYRRSEPVKYCYELLQMNLIAADVFLIVVFVATRLPIGLLFKTPSTSTGVDARQGSSQSTLWYMLPVRIACPVQPLLNNFMFHTASAMRVSISLIRCIAATGYFPFRARFISLVGVTWAIVMFAWVSGALFGMASYIVADTMVIPEFHEGSVSDMNSAVFLFNASQINTSKSQTTLCLNIWITTKLKQHDLALETMFQSKFQLELEENLFVPLENNASSIFTNLFVASVIKNYSTVDQKYHGKDIPDSNNTHNLNNNNYSPIITSAKSTPTTASDHDSQLNALATSFFDENFYYKLNLASTYWIPTALIILCKAYVIKGLVKRRCNNIRRSLMRRRQWLTEKIAMNLNVNQRPRNYGTEFHFSPSSNSQNITARHQIFETNKIPNTHNGVFNSPSAHDMTSDLVKEKCSDSISLSYQHFPSISQSSAIHNEITKVSFNVEATLHHNVVKQSSLSLHSDLLHLQKQIQIPNDATNETSLVLPDDNLGSSRTSNNIQINQQHLRKSDTIIYQCNALNLALTRCSFSCSDLKTCVDTFSSDEFLKSARAAQINSSYDQHNANMSLFSPETCKTTATNSVSSLDKISSNNEWTVSVSMIQMKPVYAFETEGGVGEYQSGQRHQPDSYNPKKLGETSINSDKSSFTKTCHLPARKSTDVKFGLVRNSGTRNTIHAFQHRGRNFEDQIQTTTASLRSNVPSRQLPAPICNTSAPAPTTSTKSFHVSYLNSTNGQGQLKLNHCLEPYYNSQPNLNKFNVKCDKISAERSSNFTKSSFCLTARGNSDTTSLNITSSHNFDEDSQIITQPTRRIAYQSDRSGTGGTHRTSSTSAFRNLMLLFRNVIIYLCCWTPYYVVISFEWTNYFSETVLNLLEYLVVLSSVLNPLLYK